ncbi:MAG TPA: AbrB/MazE/SpoVT family DNA-binding domain-containing protein [Solirubrobacteraceae bacterium]|nr:AbrB/MazE/SpoVT family DNA-binding domain-containing protein [Solirubrobacteraceae bacterium]
MLSTVSEKGQITVPKRLRERLGIHPGDRLELVEDEGRLVVTKTVPGDGDPVDAVYGILSLDVSTDEAIRTLRGEPDAV